MPIEWANKGVRKEDYVRARLRQMERSKRFGVYLIFKSMEIGPSFRISNPKYATKDPNYRIIAPQKSRYTHIYFYIAGVMDLDPGDFRVADDDGQSQSLEEWEIDVNMIRLMDDNKALLERIAQMLTKLIKSRLPVTLPGPSPGPSPASLVKL